MRKSIFILSILFSFTAYCEEISGYQNIKFGITFAQLRALNKCDFSFSAKLKDYTGIKSVNPETGIQTEKCENFMFNGEKKPASFNFFQGKLVRMTISLESCDSSFEAALTKKYGQPIHDSDGTIESYSNGQVILASVCIGQKTDTMMLSYISQEFLNLKKESKQKESLQKEKQLQESI